jgi:hypothetical protein
VYKVAARDDQQLTVRAVAVAFAIRTAIVANSITRCSDCGLRAILANMLECLTGPDAAENMAAQFAQFDATAHLVTADAMLNSLSRNAAATQPDPIFS